MEASLYVIGFAVCGMVFIVINFYRAWREIHHAHQTEAREFVDKLVNQKMILLEIEAVDDQFLCYNALTKEFVCMGRNMDEVVNRFQQRYPNKSAGIVKDDPVAQLLKKA